MGQHILSVWKNLNNAETSISFYIFEQLDEPLDVGGGLLYNRHVESFERLRPYEKKKAGYFNKHYVSENEWEVFFEIEKESITFIMETAVSLIQEFPENYPKQYVEFLKRLSAQGVHKR